MELKDFDEAIKLLLKYDEIKNITIYDGKKIRFSNMDNEIIDKLIKSIESTSDQIEFGMKIQELEIFSNNQMMKIFKEDKRIIILKLLNVNTVNKSIKEIIQNIFRLIEEKNTN
ncbi:MAG: hypothetical protein ACTSRP_02950 [Candidatus Helarchaeota archaeon]